MRKNPNGFTLAEMIVVISIIGIMLAVGVLSYSQAIRKTRDSRRVADMQAIGSALELFYKDHGRYPGEHDGIPRCGQFIGVGDLGEPCDTGVGPNFGVESGGNYQSIDDVLAPYMDRVPHDPLHDMNDTDSSDVITTRYFYAYDPYHNITVTKQCNRVEPNHPYYKSSCNCSTLATPGVVYGFRRTESKNPGNIQYESCNGTDMQLDNAHYNTTLYPGSI